MADEMLIKGALAASASVGVLSIILGYEWNKVRNNGPLKLKNMPRQDKLPDVHDTSKEAFILSLYDEGRHIGCPYESLDLMHYILKRKNYKVSEISRYKPEEDIEDKINQRVLSSNEKSKTFLYFSVHGINRDGLMGISFPYERTISPEELFSLTGRIKGKKAVLIDSCHSGVFTDFLKNGQDLIKDYVVVAACPADRVAKSKQRGWDGYVGHLTFGFYLMIEQNGWNPVDLASADIKSGTRLERIIQGFREKIGIPTECTGGGKLSMDVQRATDTSYLF